MAMRVIALLSVFVALGFAPAPFPKGAARVASPKLSGEWEVVSDTSWASDDEVAVGELYGTTARIESGFIGVIEGSMPWQGWSFSFSPNARPPQVDLRRARSDRLMLGIYKLEGDILTI